MGWFLPMFLDLDSVCSLHLASRNIPTRFGWLTSRNLKLVKCKILQQVLFCSDMIMSFYKGFCQLLNYMQINRWLHLLSNFCRIPLRCDLFRRRTDQKKLIHGVCYFIITKSAGAQSFLAFHFQFALRSVYFSLMVDLWMDTLSSFS